MKVAIRVDSSWLIGTGHVFRCLTLADALRAEGIECVFFCQNLEGSVHHLVREKGYLCIELNSPHKNPSDIQASHPPHAHFIPFDQTVDSRDFCFALTQSGSYHAVITDHYALDSVWEEQVKALTPFIVAIDDLADRHHKCSVVIDQNYFENIDERYKHLVTPDCRLFLGPKFSLVRPAFRKSRKQENIKTLENIVVFMGGADRKGIAYKMISELVRLPDIAFTFRIITGASDSFKENWSELCKAHPNVEYLGFTDNLAQIMSECDLFLGSGGTVTWERFCVGLPGIVLSVAQNQDRMSEDLDKIGAQIFLGPADAITCTEIAQTILQLHENLNKINAMQKICMDLVDGNGARRIAKYIANFCQSNDSKRGPIEN